MKNENLIHVKIGYDEALNSRRDLLSSEADLIEIMKIMGRYKLLRIEELKLKIKLSKKIKEAVLNLRKIQEALPRLEIPEFRKKEQDEIKELSKKIKNTYDENLESQLKEIREKLRGIGER